MDEKRAPTIIQKCKAVVEDHYGPRLAGIVLYGSMARGEGQSRSDIDLLVLLSSSFDYFAELRQLIDLLYPIQLESDQLISAKPVLASDFEMGSLSLYRNARREGMVM